MACAFGFWGMKHVAERTSTEDYARDSIDNLLFGIGRFYECVGRFPEQVTVVSWKFKEERLYHHAWSIRWPLSRFRFEGASNPHIGLEKAVSAERHALEYFKQDASGYGMEKDDGLGYKKLARNPYRRQHGYATSCPSLAPILAWRNKTRVREDMVPWDCTEPNSSA